MPKEEAEVPHSGRLLAVSKKSIPNLTAEVCKPQAIAQIHHICFSASLQEGENSDQRGAITHRLYSI